MTCYHPIKGYRSKEPTANGKYPFTRDPKKSDGSFMEIPCQQCIGCRLRKSGEWAARISHEASLYEKNCFITLTYSEEHLPKDGSLRVRDFQLFLKRLRKKYGSKIRFFHCGEYGESLGRPHYHACLLNFDFPDKYLWEITPRGDHVYRSPSLEELWPVGISNIGSVTFESAGYVARYITKKRTGEMAKDYYLRVDPDTGEIFELKPEYTTMSRKPGIASEWFKKYKSDVFPHDSIVLPGGRKIPPPKYYNTLYEILEPEKYALIKSKRLHKSCTDLAKNVRESTPERLNVKEIVHQRTIETLKRKMER